MEVSEQCTDRPNPTNLSITDVLRRGLCAQLDDDVEEPDLSISDVLNRVQQGEEEELGDFDDFEQEGVAFGSARHLSSVLPAHSMRQMYGQNVSLTIDGEVNAQIAGAPLMPPTRHQQPPQPTWPRFAVPQRLPFAPFGKFEPTLALRVRSIASSEPSAPPPAPLLVQSMYYVDPDEQ